MNYGYDLNSDVKINDDVKWNDRTSKDRCMKNIYSFDEINKRIEILNSCDIEFYFVRHGETDYNKHFLVTGSKNPPLNEKGELQARNLKEHLKGRNYDLVVSSAQTRAIQTKEIFIDSNPDAKEALVVSDERLNEVNLGVLEGKKKTYIKEFSEGDVEYKGHNGESYLDAATRVGSFLSDIPKIINQGSVVVFCHAGILRIILSYFGNEISSRKGVFMNNISNTECFKFNSSQCKLSSIWEEKE